MIPYTIKMTPKTVRALEAWVRQWSAVWSVEGTVLLAAAFRRVLHTPPAREAAYAHLTAAGEALTQVKFTKSTAKLSLLGLTDEQVSGLIWVMMVARTGHAGQNAAYERLCKLVERFNRRSPLIRLAECAQ
jgi:hypothetical protein